MVALKESAKRYAGIAAELIWPSTESEFHYYTRDKRGNLLKEPCGFPGRWTVELKLPRGGGINAAVQRAVKSFAYVVTVELFLSSSHRYSLACLNRVFILRSLYPGTESVGSSYNA